MALSRRMQMVADLLPEGLTVADVGCDHGFVSIFLIQNHRSPRVIAMDINQGPLARAGEHVKENHLEDKIELRLSDGLKEVKDGEVEAAVIAGMGGRLMVKILSDRPELVKKLKAIVLQPQSDLAFVRNTLCRQGFSFLKEDMVREDGKYYPAFLIVYTGQQNRSLKPEEALFGPLLLKEKHPVLLQYIRKEKDKFLQIEKKIKENNREDAPVTERIQLIEKALGYYAQEEI